MELHWCQSSGATWRRRSLAPSMKACWNSLRALPTTGAVLFLRRLEAKGHARKTTGSYYTPDALVQVLLDSALDPVLDRVEMEAEDPAAGPSRRHRDRSGRGSGHFLLAAARRIATRLARARVAASPPPKISVARCVTWRGTAFMGWTAIRWRSSLLRWRYGSRPSNRVSRWGSWTPLSAAATRFSGSSISTRYARGFRRRPISPCQATTRKLRNSSLREIRREKRGQGGARFRHGWWEPPAATSARRDDGRYSCASRRQR